MLRFAAKKFLVALSITLSLTSLGAKKLDHDHKTSYQVAITQIVEHPSLDSIRQGILDELASQGFTQNNNLTVTYDNAQGNIVIAAQIAQRFIALAPDVIVAIATPSAQTAVNAMKDANIPIVFGAVTDPLSAKITRSLERPDNNATGTIDLPPAKDQLIFIKELFPKIKTLGILYNPGESNNIKQVARLKKAAGLLGFNIIEATATRTADVALTAKYLTSKVEAILIPNDNTIISALESVLKPALQNHIPVFTSDPDSVKKGALGAIANDQYDVGRMTGKIVAQILHGKPAEEIPIKAVQIAKRYINQKMAGFFGLQTSADILF